MNGKPNSISSCFLCKLHLHFHLSTETTQITVHYSYLTENLPVSKNTLFQYFADDPVSFTNIYCVAEEVLFLHSKGMNAAIA